MDITNRKTLIYEKLSSFMVVALGILMPLFFLTTTTEFFEFNKLALLTIVTVLLVVLLGARVFTGGSFQFVRSSMDLPIFIYLLIYGVSTLFSLDKNASVWGAQGRWFPGLFAMIIMALFYYLAAPNFKEAKNVKMAIYSLLAGGTISTLVAILGYFGIYLGDSSFLRNPAFTLTGSPTTAVMLAAMASIFAAYFTYKESFIPAKISLLTAFVVNFIYVSLVGGSMGWVMFCVGLVLAFLTIGAATVIQDRVSTMFLTTTLVTIVFLHVFPATRSIITKSSYPNEIKLPVKESWVISTATIQDYPLLATGPSTFNINYTKYRPLSQNNTNVWNVRFDKPYNEVFNTIATTGVLGLLALILFAVSVTKFALINIRSKNTDGTAQILATGVIMILVSYIFTYSTVISTFILFYLLAILSAAHVTSGDRKSGEMLSFSFSSFAAATTTIGETSAIRREYANIVAITPFVIASLFGLYLFGKTYLAENYMRRAIVAALNNQAALAYDLQGKAINMNPKRDTYQTAYAQTNLILANALAAKQNLSDQDKQTVQTLVSQAIRSSRVATELINPQNVTNWETRALIYRSLINAADNATDWAIGSYNSAIQLDPTNPSLRVDLGGVYFAKADFLAAANLFRQATALKPDYANAHYNFAQALLNLKDYDNAKREFEVTRSLVQKDSNDYKLVSDQLSALDKQTPTVAGAATEKKPTVEEITGTTGVGTTQPPAAQQPLSNPTQPQQGQNLNPQVLPKTEETKKP